MAICKQCGHPVNDDLDYCERCGTLIEDIDESLVENITEGDEELTNEEILNDIEVNDIVEDISVEAELEEQLIEQDEEEHESDSDSTEEDNKKNNKDTVDKKSKNKTEKKGKNKKEKKEKVVKELDPSIVDTDYLIKQYLLCMIPIYGIYVIIKLCTGKGNTSDNISNVMKANVFIVSIWIIIACIINYMLGDMVIRI